MQGRPSNYWDKYSAMLIYVEELVLMKDSREKRECGFVFPGRRQSRDNRSRCMIGSKKTPIN